MRGMWDEASPPSYTLHRRLRPTFTGSTLQTPVSTRRARLSFILVLLRDLRASA